MSNGLISELFNDLIYQTVQNDHKSLLEYFYLPTISLFPFSAPGSHWSNFFLYKFACSGYLIISGMVEYMVFSLHVSSLFLFIPE